ncbi:MAG: hypothetical protein AAFX50_15510, partial [Acidobacteriota bacterium]
MDITREAGRPTVGGAEGPRRAIARHVVEPSGRAAGRKHIHVAVAVGGADFAARLTENFGITGGISYYNREFQTDNIEADDWQLEDGQIYAEEVQY